MQPLYRSSDNCIQVFTFDVVSFSTNVTRHLKGTYSIWSYCTMMWYIYLSKIINDNIHYIQSKKNIYLCMFQWLMTVSFPTQLVEIEFWLVCTLSNSYWKRWQSVTEINILLSVFLCFCFDLFCSLIRYDGNLPVCLVKDLVTGYSEHLFSARKEFKTAWSLINNNALQRSEIIWQCMFWIE